MITYLLAIFSAIEMKKTVNKRMPKSHTIQLTTDEPWSTVEAQLLVKISAALSPLVLDISHYDIMCYIPRVLPKPSMGFSSETDYSILQQRIEKMTTKDPTINVTIIQAADPLDKENVALDENTVEQGKKKGQRRNPATLPGNINKNQKIKLLQEHWKCPKQQSLCLGTYCFTGEDRVHLALSHEMLECWASALVSSFHF
jgi:hypothetical protein